MRFAYRSVIGSALLKAELCQFILLSETISRRSSFLGGLTGAPPRPVGVTLRPLSGRGGSLSDRRRSVTFRAPLTTLLALEVALNVAATGASSAPELAMIPVDVGMIWLEP